ncbi:hypothetical protein N431DRAFT_548372 [Stipitochalara longipes BDJ]|nr:hypothetical protein N431DRAFT_548372 [Stipitochalara longipes BDJ]
MGLQRELALSSSPAPRRLGETSFRYQDLDPKSRNIRLLRILPETTSIIKCELFSASLDNHCQYIAISYAWGDPDDTRIIILDGHEFPVTESLMLALQRLRSRSTAVIVWADAIYINQGNIDERNQQVQAMTSIYQQAGEVALWLGPEADDSNMALELMFELYRHKSSKTIIRAIIQSPDRRDSFNALVALFDREYWGRLWVVQEVLNGNNKMVYCGSSSLPWNFCVTASDILRRHYADMLHAFLYTNGVAAISASGRTYPGQLSCGGPAVLHDLREDGFSCGLLNVLLYHQEKNCADPRDRLYGLFGILSEDERSHFSVNYNSPVREVYIEVVDTLLTTTRRLDIICASISFPVHQNIHGLPSWCPDWSQRRRILPIGDRFPGFSASGALEAKVAFSNKRRILNVTAIFLGKITSCGVPLNPPICKGALLMAFFEWLEKLKEVKGFNQLDHEAFCRTLCCGQLPEEYTPKDWMERTYRTFALGLRGRYPGITLDSHLMSYVQDFIPLSLGKQKETLTENFTNAMTGRCFATTQEGLLCLGSGALQVEDIICVPLGCQTPIIIRRRGDEFTFIGDIYVDGYMGGKAVNDYENKLRKLETFAIQ